MVTVACWVSVFFGAAGMTDFSAPLDNFPKRGYPLRVICSQPSGIAPPELAPRPFGQH